MKSSYFNLVAIGAMFVSYVVYKINKKINKSQNENEEETLSHEEKVAETFKINEQIKKFEATVIPDYKGTKKIIILINIGCLIFPHLIDHSSPIQFKLIITILLIIFGNTFFSIFFILMNHKKIEIKDGEITLYGFLGSKYRLSLFSIEAIKYRVNNKVIELKETRNDDINNEYKIKLLNYTGGNVLYILSFFNTVGKHNKVKLEEDF